MNELIFLGGATFKMARPILRRVAMTLVSVSPRHWYWYLRPGYALGNWRALSARFQDVPTKNARS